jgi:hypothetical protein
MRKAFLLLLTIGMISGSGCSEDKATGQEKPTTGSMQITVLQGDTPVPFSTLLVTPTQVSAQTSDRISTTDADGHATVRELPGGTYSVTASKCQAGLQHFGEKTDVSISPGSTATVIVVLVNSESDPFPLALGNWWAFDSGDTIEVGRTKVIDGVTTYTLGLRGQDIHPGYHTHGRNAIYKHGYETTTGADHIIRPPTVWMDFTATAGECWTIRDWGQGCLDSEWETVQTPLGEFTDCWKFRLISGDGNEFTFWLKDGIGPVKTLFFGETALLTSYELK